MAPDVGFVVWVWVPVPVPVEVEVPELVVFAVRLASCWNAAKLLGPVSTALMEKTMPAPQ